MGEEGGGEALSLFRFHLSPFPPKTPDTQARTIRWGWGRTDGRSHGSKITPTSSPGCFRFPIWRAQLRAALV